MVSFYKLLYYILLAIIIIPTVFLVVITITGIHAEQVNHDFRKCVKIFDYETCDILYPPLNFQKV